MDRKLRVLIVDDSATVRRFLSDLVNSTPDMEVVGEARDGGEAVALARQLRPDIISMDIQMPGMDGLAATELLMQQQPLPIVIVSSRLERNETVDLAFLALQAGALAVLKTPPAASHPAYPAARDQFLGTLRAMAAVSVVRRWKTRPLPTPEETLPRAAPPLVIAIGASAGGPMALHSILGALPADFPVPIAVVQHMAEGFTEGLVRWLDSSSPLRVRLAEEGQIIRPGEVAVAGNAGHLLLRRAGDRVRVHVEAERGPTPYQPSVDRLFASAAASFGSRAVGILLTGMGEDGARGLLEMRRQGARTIAQDEHTCLVYGMPRAAVDLDAAEHILPLKAIASVLLELARATSTE